MLLRRYLCLLKEHFISPCELVALPMATLSADTSGIDHSDIDLSEFLTDGTDLLSE